MLSQINAFSVQQYALFEFFFDSKENLKYINLNVLKTYKKIFKDIILGLSDHTHGHATVLGAITMGARIVEKHFTLSNDNEGPSY